MNKKRDHLTALAMAPHVIQKMDSPPYLLLLLYKHRHVLIHEPTMNGHTALPNGFIRPVHDESPNLVLDN